MCLGEESGITTSCIAGVVASGASGASTRLGAVGQGLEPAARRSGPVHGAGIEGASGEGLQACAKSRAHMNRSEDRLRAQVSGGRVASFLPLVGAWLGLGLGLRLLGLRAGGALVCGPPAGSGPADWWSGSNGWVVD